MPQKKSSFRKFFSKTKICCFSFSNTSSELLVGTAVLTSTEHEWVENRNISMDTVEDGAAGVLLLLGAPGAEV